MYNVPKQINDLLNLPWNRSKVFSTTVLADVSAIFKAMD